MRWLILPFIPDAVAPNHVTILRMIMTPFVLWLLFLGNYVVGVPLFVLVAFTDVVDGSLARVRNKITPWGIFFDPIADKFLIGSVTLVIALKYYHPLIVFPAIALDMLPAIVFLARARPNGQIMMANVWGKAKMFLQFTSLACLLLAITLELGNLAAAGEVILGISLIFSLIAAVTYSL